MNWKLFKSDLLYDYTRFLLKSLNNHELVFMKELRRQTDHILDNGLEWVDENTELIQEFNDKDEWLDYYYDESTIEMIMVSLLGRFEYSTNNMIRDFYQTGGRIGYNHMSKPVEFYSSDEKALGNLQRYVDRVNKSIQGEVAYGVIKSIGDNIENHTTENIKTDIINIPYSKVDHHITPDTRVLFATKTEYARAVNTGLLQSYSNYGVDSYDWVTSGLRNTCNRCFELEDGSPYTLNEIINLCPVHVNCACSMKARLPKTLFLQDKPVIVDITPQRKGE